MAKNFNFNKTRGQIMKIYFITDSQKFYGQKLYPWESLDIDKIISKLSSEYEVEHVTFFDVVNTDLDISNAIILYSSSQQHEYKEYIEDILIYLMQKENTLIPSFNTFKSHENKGYQELHKKLLNIDSLNSIYAGHHKEIKDEHLTNTMVLKSLDGFGSGGVSLINSKKEIINATTKKECLLDKGLLQKVRTFIAKPIKKYILRREIVDFKSRDYYDYFKRFVLQQLVPSLAYDYKVLIFDNKYYVLKRYVNEDDFRASGSGNFAFEKVENALLDYSKTLYEKFNEPMMAFDICFDGERYYLIEFQGLHFGPYTLMESLGYYENGNSQWKFIEKKSDLDEEVSQSLLNYLQHNYPNDLK